MVNSSYFRSPPDAHKLELPESIFRSFFAEVNWFLQKLYEISSGKDWKLFGLVNLTSFTPLTLLTLLSRIDILGCSIQQATTSLSLLSIIATCFSPLNLLYIGK